MVNLKNIFLVIAILGFHLNGGDPVSAEEKAAKPKNPPPLTLEKPLPQRTPAAAPGRPTFAVVLGSITRIDTKDPAKPRIEVKADADNATHLIEISPWTSLTKVADLSELKVGDNVRIMTRKIENNEVAMNVMFGKIKSPPPPREVVPAESRTIPKK